MLGLELVDRLGDQVAASGFQFLAGHGDVWILDLRKGDGLFEEVMGEIGCAAGGSRLFRQKKTWCL